MTHIAVQEALNSSAVEWLEHVSDEQYGGDGVSSMLRPPIEALSFPWICARGEGTPTCSFAMEKTRSAKLLMRKAASEGDLDHGECCTPSKSVYLL